MLSSSTYAAANVQLLCVYVSQQGPQCMVLAFFSALLPPILAWRVVLVSPVVFSREHAVNEDKDEIYTACASLPFLLLCTSWLSFTYLFPVEISCLYHLSASILGIQWLPCLWPLLNQRVRETESNIWNELPPCQPIYWANSGRHFTYSTFFHPSLPICSLWFFFFFWTLVIWRKESSIATPRLLNWKCIPVRIWLCVSQCRQVRYFPKLLVN